MIYQLAAYLLTFIKDIQHEFDDVYAKFSVNYEYSIFLTTETLFQIALPASWPLPKKPNLQHISIDSSSSGNHSHRSSHVSQGSLSPKRRQFYESLPPLRLESSEDDKISPLTTTKTGVQSSGKGKAPIAQASSSEDLIVNSENGEEWFSRYDIRSIDATLLIRFSLEIRISKDVDQGEWEKCRLQIFRQNEVLYSGPTIRVRIEKASGETVDELGGYI